MGRSAWAVVLIALLLTGCVLADAEEPPTPTPTPTPLGVYVGVQVGPETPTPSPEPESTAAPAPPDVPHPEEPAVVDRVVDGDTIDVVLEGEIRRVRFILVDTPEVHGRVECYGPEASEFVKGLLPPGTLVYLERDVSETDRFGRLLRYVYLADGRMLNEILLAEGYAQVATFPPDVQYVDRFLDVQREAREAGRGLWTACAEPAPSPTSTAAEGGGITVVTLTSPVAVGATARLTVTTSAASCTLAYTTPRGTASSAQGLGSTTVRGGQASWSWRIGTSTQPGTGIIRVDCGADTLTAPIEIR